MSTTTKFKVVLSEKQSSPTDDPEQNPGHDPGHDDPGQNPVDNKDNKTTTETQPAKEVDKQETAASTDVASVPDTGGGYNSPSGLAIGASFSALGLFLLLSTFITLKLVKQHKTKTNSILTIKKVNSRPQMLINTRLVLMPQSLFRSLLCILTLLGSYLLYFFQLMTQAILLDYDHYLQNKHLV